MGAAHCVRDGHPPPTVGEPTGPSIMASVLKDSPLLEYKVRSPSGSQQPAHLASSPGRGCRSMVAYTGSRQPGGALSVASRSRRFWGASVWLLRLGQLCYWTVRPLIVTRLFGCPGWSTNHGSHDSQEFGEMLASLEALAPFAAGAWTRWPALLARALAENESLSPAAAAAPAAVAPTHPATPRSRSRSRSHTLPPCLPCPALPCAPPRGTRASVRCQHVPGVVILCCMVPTLPRGRLNHTPTPTPLHAQTITPSS